MAGACALLFSFMTLVGAALVMGVSLLTIVVPNELRGLSVAAMIAVNTLFAVALAPLMVSVLSETLGDASMVGRALAIVCTASSVVGAAAFCVGARSLAARADFPA